MTTVITTPQDRTITIVQSAHGRRRQYLEIVTEGEGVRIQPTELGKKALNRFWPMWLRQLVLEQTGWRRSYSVEVRDHSVHVRARTELAHVVGTLQYIAAAIRPLNEPPLLRRYPDYGGPELYWDIKYGHRFIPWDLLTPLVELPKSATLTCDQWFWGDDGRGSLCLRHPDTHLLSLSQVGMLVEWQIAQACHR